MVMTDNYMRKGIITRVIDGDTVEATLDLGYYVHVTERFRLLRVNAPEVHGLEKEQGLQVKEYVTNRLLGKEVMISSTKTDSFKRWLAEIYLLEDGTNISDELLGLEMAKPFVK